MFNMLNNENENNDNDKKIFKTEKDVLMYYQTSIRNVALTTAVSFAALGYSRFYRDKSLLYTNGMVFVSFLLVLCSALINLFLFTSIQEYLNTYEEINKLSNINKLFMGIHVILIFFALYTFYRIIFNQRFKSLI